jgi:RNA polymerase sigma-70 factor (ECF subfamily)
LRANPHQDVTELVLRVQRGDRRAFGILVSRYRARIYALALHLTGNSSDADDITQDAFIRAYRAIDSFAGRSEFFTWLYRIVINLSHSAVRSRARRPWADLDDPRAAIAAVVDSGGDPQRCVELRQSYARLVRALDELSPTLRSTVVLVALQGLSYGEAAVVFGCTEGTIGWRIHEARSLLRRAMDDSPVPPRPRTDAERIRRLLS